MYQETPGCNLQYTSRVESVKSTNDQRFEWQENTERETNNLDKSEKSDT